MCHGVNDRPPRCPDHDGAAGQDRVSRRGLVLDVAGASFDDGAPLVQFPFHGGDNQLFRLEPING